MTQLFRKSLLSLTSVCLVSACASTTLTNDSISAIQKGNSPEQVQKITMRKPVKYTQFTVSDNLYFAERYNIQVGTRTQVSNYCNNKDNEHVRITSFCYIRSAEVPVTKPFFLIYDEKNQLITWNLDNNKVKPEYEDVFSTAVDKLSRRKKIL